MDKKNKKLNKIEEAIKAMKNMTVAENSWGVNYQPYSSQWTPQWGDEVQEPLRLIIFFGFNGMLAQKYSILTMSKDEIVARLQFAGDKVPYLIKDYSDFMFIVDQMKDTPNALREIPFDDAMNIIRIGIGKLEVVEFEDAEEDEFNDNCLATCKPGSHKCKK